MLAESCQKCELHNWWDAPRNNLWSNSTTGDSGGVVASIIEGEVVKIARYVNELHHGGVIVPSGSRWPSPFIISLLL